MTIMKAKNLANTQSENVDFRMTLTTPILLIEFLVH